MPLKLNIDITDASIITAADDLGVKYERLIYVLEKHLVLRVTKTRTPRVVIKKDTIGDAEVLLAIAAGAVGFRGGWVSSHYLPTVLTERMPRNRRPAMLARLGYVPHPALKQGRCNRPVMPDGVRPVLYVHKDHPALALTAPADIERAYTAAQCGAHSGA